MNEVLANNGPLGEISIEDEVIVAIVQKAIEGIEGVHSLSGGKVLGKFGGVKGIKVVREKEGVKLFLQLNVYYGYRLLELASLVQRKVKDQLTLMTEFDILSVDVHIQTIVFQENQEEVGENHEES